MITSPISFQSDATCGERIPLETLGYLRARAKRQAFDLVIKQFKKSGLTKAELARRLGKGAPEISRMLGGPANWTIATVADLLFAIGGGVPTWDVSFPATKAKRNDTRPAWLYDAPENKLMKIISSSSQANTTSMAILGGNNPSTNKPNRPIQLGL
ncbi:MAG: helix-turn-helix transcriptional regulator [Afipia sp.]|nr:helix-turn-helix transcriptional regulator [Afipia sp.]